MKSQRSGEEHYERIFTIPGITVWAKSGTATSRLQRPTWAFRRSGGVRRRPCLVRGPRGRRASWRRSPPSWITGGSGGQRRAGGEQISSRARGRGISARPRKSSHAVRVGDNDEDAGVTPFRGRAIRRWFTPRERTRFPRMIVLFRNIIGSNTTLKHGAWLCIASGLGPDLLGLYAIDLGALIPPSGPLPVTIEGVVFKQILFLRRAHGRDPGGAPHHKIVRSLAWPSMIVVLGLLAFLLSVRAHEHRTPTQRRMLRGSTWDRWTFSPRELAKIAFVLVAAHAPLSPDAPPASSWGWCFSAFRGRAHGASSCSSRTWERCCFFVPVLFAMLFVSGAQTSASGDRRRTCSLARLRPTRSSKPHQKKRIEGLLIMKDPPRVTTSTSRWSPPRRRGQRRGLGQSDGRAHPHPLQPPPQRHNDMIFPIIVCRFGLFGGVLVGAACTACGSWKSTWTAAFSKTLRVCSSWASRPSSPGGRS